MIKNIYKLINNDYQNFKNISSSFYFDNSVQTFVKENPLIENVAQQKELIRMIFHCTVFNLSKTMVMLNTIKNNQEYFHDVLSNHYKDVDIKKSSIIYLQNTVLLLFLDHKESIMTSESKICANFVKLKEALDTNDIEKTKFLLKVVLNEYVHETNLKILSVLQSHIPLFKFIDEIIF